MKVMFKKVQNIEVFIVRKVDWSSPFDGFKTSKVNIIVTCRRYLDESLGEKYKYYNYLNSGIW